MNLTIKGVTPTPHAPNSYEVVINTMMGDAEGYQNVIVRSFIKGQDEGSLESLLSTIESASKMHQDHTKNYNQVEGFLAWFGANIVDDEEDLTELSPALSYEQYLADFAIAEKFQSHTSFWPYDITNDNRRNYYVDFKVYYYDENLVQHDVEVS